MILYQFLHVSKDLGVALVGGPGHVGQVGRVFLHGIGVGGCGLRVEDEGNGEEALVVTIDPSV